MKSKGIQQFGKHKTEVLNCTFELLPTIDIMIDLYEKPRTFERFQEYLKTLQGGTKGGLAMPIAGFNPMAKEHILDSLKELKKLGAEQIIEETLNNLNDNVSLKSLNRKFKVAINLSDDLKGGWTNRFTTDYDSKFKINGLFNRNFCTPIFWTSEKFTKDVIRERTLEYIFRAVYWLTKPKPKTLKEHLEQEIFVASQVKSKGKFQETDFISLNKFYEDNKNTDNYHIIFNFFYGDTASASLKFPTYAVIENVTGFEYSIYSEEKSK
ncbi:hypothetical protein [Ferruginibacter sp.]|nr:hypothetical protein [Ferruginibacter sp.]